MDLSAKQLVYAGLGVLGFGVTLYFNLQLIAEHGSFDIGAFLADGFANPAAASLTSDLTVAFIAFLFWLPFEANRVGMRHWWIYVVLGFTLAFAVAFPAFLFMRERKLAAAALPAG